MQQIYEFIANKQTISRVFMLFLCCLLLSTSTFAQNSSARITIHKKNISVIEALKEVEKQTKLSVGYNESQLKNKPSINLALEKATLESSLKEILRNTGYTYQLKGKYVIIVPQEKQEVETASAKRITGRVLDDNGEPLIGVNVHVEGTSVGSITDMDGNFILEAPVGSVLSISYVGYTPQTVKVTGQNTYSVQLVSDTKLLSEVVVTALGIKREQKALSYNVQQVKSDELTQIKDANFVNSLNGKVAGVTINTSSSGVGGASRVVMRGTKSIEQSSNALYVIDGIPMYNFGGGGDTEFGSKGATEAIADINPEDIESISVLTGAAAAALYGSNAANGAIVITTKKGQVGKLQVGVSSGIFAKGTVRNCYADVKVIGSSRAGGIVAEPRNAVVVENCFATGTLYSTGNAGGIAGGLNGNNPTIKGCIAWNEQIDGEPVSGRVIGWQSNTYTKATDCYAKKDMIIAWGPNKGMTGTDANTAGTYDWGNNKTAICHGITRSKS